VARVQGVARPEERKLRTAVQGVAGDGAAPEGQVRAHLVSVGAARFDLHEGPAPGAPEDAVGGARRTRRRVTCAEGRHAPGVLGVGPEPGVDLAGRTDGLRLDQGQVALRETLGLDGFAQRVEGFSGARGEEHSGGLGIEPMDEPWFARVEPDVAHLRVAR